MSVYPNPNTIININTTKTITAEKPQYLRTFAICSSGDTNLKVGDCVFISPNDIETILNPLVTDNYTKKWLNSFFKHCIGKLALVIELGTENTTTTYPMLETLDLSQNLELEVGTDLSNTLKNKYNYTFGYQDDDLESKEVFTLNTENTKFDLRGLKSGNATLQVIASGSDISTTKFLLNVITKEKLQFNLDNRIFSFNSVVDTDQPETDVISRIYNITSNANKISVKLTKEDGSEIEENDPDVVLNGKSFTIESGKNTGKYKLTLICESDENTMYAESEFIVEVKPSKETLDNTEQDVSLKKKITEITRYNNRSIVETKYETLSYIDILKDYIQENKKIRAYKYSVSRKIMSHSDFIDLVDNYSKIDSSCYFSGETIKNQDPNTDPIFSKLKTKKAFFAVFNNCLNNNDILDGAITGIMASASYDITTSNAMSPLQFKYINLDFNQVSLSFSDKLTDSPASWIGYQAGQKVLFGARYCDYEFWDYWYSWDNVREIVISNVTTFIINATNVQNSAIRYNQNGITNISLNIENTLNNLITLGFITRYGEYLEQSTQELVNISKIGSIDFETYIKNNPDKYEKGVYDGYSCYIQIGRFIIQITFNINLG